MRWCWVNFQCLTNLEIVRQRLTVLTKGAGGGRVVRWCWVIFHSRGVLLIWIRVGQGLTVLAVGEGEGCLDIFSLVYQFSILSPSLWMTARYRLKYCLKGPLSPKQPTNQLQKVRVGVGWTFFLSSIISLFSPSLWERPDID